MFTFLKARLSWQYIEHFKKVFENCDNLHSKLLRSGGSLELTMSVTSRHARGISKKSINSRVA